jgi:predicted O-methyltransferase YrrM
MPCFTEDWFSHHLPHWERLFFQELGWDPGAPRHVVEIGSFEGRSTLWFLEHLLLHPASRITCIDSFEGGAEHSAAQTAGLYDRFRANIAESGAAQKVEVLRGDSFQGLVRLLGRGESAELVYVDGSHEAPDVLADLVLAFRLLPPGGMILCDDYLWSREETAQADVLGCPKLAIDAFTNIHRRRIEFVEWASRRLLTQPRHRCRGCLDMRRCSPGMRGWAACRQPDRDRRSKTRRALNTKRAAGAQGEAARHGQAEAGALTFRLCREEWLADAREGRGIHALSRVPHRDARVHARRQPGRVRPGRVRPVGTDGHAVGRDDDLPATRHCVASIDAEIDHGRFQLRAPGGHG